MNIADLRLCIALLAAYGVGGINSVAANSEAPALRIGATAIGAPNASVEHFQSTARQIEIVLNRPVSFKLFEVPALEKAIENGDVDLIISGAGFYKRLESHGLRILASEVTPLMPDPDKSAGTTILALKDRQDLNNLEDLRGKRLAALAPESFQGYQIGIGEILKETGRKDFFGSTTFVGRANSSDMPKVIAALLEKRADVGFVNVCYLERLQGHSPDIAAKLKVINAKPLTAGRCVVSTRLYPSASVSSLPWLDHESLRKISTALLNAPSTEIGYRWSIAGDFRPVDELFRSLHLGPYAYLDHWTLKRVWDEFHVFILSFVLGLIALIAHSLRADVLVKRRTEELRDAFAEKERLAQEKRKAEEAMEKLQRIGLIGHLSAMFAHEVKQPLNNLTCYAHGLLRILDSNPVPRDMLISGIENIRRQALICADIVERVRRNVKIQERNIRKIELCKLVQACIEELDGKDPKIIRLTMPPNEVILNADYLDVRLIIVNILKNALQAAFKTTKPIVEVCIHTKKNNHSSKVIIVVKDNGPRLSDDIFNRMKEPLFTTKSEGLGLGLFLVMGTVERLGASIAFDRAPENDGDGLTVTLIINAQSKNKV